MGLGLSWIGGLIVEAPDKDSLCISTNLLWLRGGPSLRQPWRPPVGTSSAHCSSFFSFLHTFTRPILHRANTLYRVFHSKSKSIYLRNNRYPEATRSFWQPRGRHLSLLLFHLYSNHFITTTTISTIINNNLYHTLPLICLTILPYEVFPLHSRDFQFL